MNFNKRLITSVLTITFSVFVFLLGALALVVPSGYSYGALLLLIPSLFYLFVRPYPTLHKQDFYLIVVLCGYFLLGVGSNYLHHLSHHSYDNTSRFLLAVPVLLLLLRFPIKPECWLLGMSLGAIGAAGVALWNLWGQGEWRASGHTNAIQFGDIAMLFACLLLSALPWAKKQSVVIYFVVLTAIASGIFASLLSGARGGWLALPITLIWLWFAFGFYKKKQTTITITLAFTLVLIGVYQLPQQGLLHSRVQDGLQDLQHYQDSHNITTSIGSRLHMWQRSLQMIVLRPVTGWGSQEAVVAYLDQQGIHDEVMAEFNHVHNDFLDALLKRGVLGGLAFVVLLLVPARLFYRQIKILPVPLQFTPIMGVTLIICVAVFGLTQTFFSHASGVMIYVFTLVILWAQGRAQNIT